MRTFLIAATLAAMTMLSGCSGAGGFMKPAADVGLATLSFPECRAEWERYVPLERQDAVTADYVLIDDSFVKLLALTRNSPDMTWQEGLNKLASTPATKARLERAYTNVSLAAHDWALESNTRNQVLLDCEKTMTTGWKSLFDNPQSATILEALQLLAPWAKLLPVLLVEDGEEGVRQVFVAS